jgi:hypothetical protein
MLLVFPVQLALAAAHGVVAVLKARPMPYRGY